MRALRAVAALLVAVRLLAAALRRSDRPRPGRSSDAHDGPGPTASDAVPAAVVPRPPSTAQTAVRAVLVAGGVLFIAAGLGLTASGVPVGQWRGILLWLAVAVLLHDGVLAPTLIVGARAVRRGSARLPWGALAAVQVLTVVGVAVTLLVVPALGTRAHEANPTVAVFDYPVHLAVAWALIGAAVAVALVAGRVVRSRRSAPAV